jgi:hypothetical protein
VDAQRKLTVLSVYAPHDGHNEAVKDTFYSELANEIGKIPSSHALILLGDLNASVGPSTIADNNVMGQHSLRTVNRSGNGQRLIDLCAQNQLWLSSTEFKSNFKSKSTFAPCGNTAHDKRRQLDHIAIHKRWRQCITKVKTHWQLCTSSDHGLVLADLNVRLTAPKQLKSSSTHAFHVDLLRDELIKDEYSRALASQLQTVDITNPSYDATCSAIQSAADTALGVRPKRPSHPFTFSSATEALILKRRGCIRKDKYRLSREIQNSMARDEALYYDGLAATAQKAADSGDLKCLYNTIKTISGKQRGSLPEFLRDPLDQSIKSSPNDKLNLFCAHLAKQFDFPAASEPERLLDPPPSLGTHSVHEVPNRKTVPAQLREPDSPPPFKTEGKDVDGTVSNQAWSPANSQLEQARGSGEVLSGIPIDDSPPSLEEVTKALRSLKQRKAAGPDEIQPELLIHGASAIAPIITQLLNNVWQGDSLPNIWTTSRCVPVFKKGSKLDPANYRGINLLCAATKALESIISGRISESRESTAREQQSGFRKGRGCTDHCFTLRILSEIHAEFKIPLLLTFLDFKGAFDSVDRSRMWNCLIRSGVPNKLVEVLQLLYSNQSTVVSAYKTNAAPFEPKSGVWQGGVVSPLIFNIVMDEILREAEETQLGGVSLPYNSGDHLFGSLEYADDIVIIENDPVTLQLRLDSLSTAASRFGLRFAPHKCAVLPLNCVPPHITIYDNPIPSVDQFKYLGSIFNSDASSQQDILHRIALASSTFQGMCRIWENKRITLRVKGNIYNSCVRSVLLYGAEAWTLRKSDLNDIASFDNRCMRRICKVQWQTRTSNIKVHNKLFLASADRNGDIRKVIRQRQLRWLGHVCRMDESRLPNIALRITAKPEWKRSPGGARMVWRRQMLALTEPLTKNKRGRHLIPSTDNSSRANYAGWVSLMTSVAQDRDQWRRVGDQLAHGLDVTMVVHGRGPDGDTARRVRRL